MQIAFRHANREKWAVLPHPFHRFQRFRDDFVHVVILVFREPTAEQDVRLFFGEGAILFVQGVVLFVQRTETVGKVRVDRTRVDDCLGRVRVLKRSACQLYRRRGYQ